MEKHYDKHYVEKVICTLKGHNYKPFEILNGGIYSFGRLIFPHKKYRCTRCGEETVGDALAKAEREQLKRIMGWR